jgi:hypothetical protein
MKFTKAQLESASIELLEAEGHEMGKFIKYRPQKV